MKMSLKNFTTVQQTCKTDSRKRRTRRNANMNEVLDGIRSQVGAENLSDSYIRDGCRVSMEDVPSRRVVADADRAFPAHRMEGKRCDYVLFFISAAKNTLFAVSMHRRCPRNCNGVRNLPSALRRAPSGPSATRCCSMVRAFTRSNARRSTAPRFASAAAN